MTEPAIAAAVKARDTDKVRTLLTQDPALARIVTEDGSLLLTAIYYGAREAAALIRAQRDDLDVFEAAVVGDIERLRQLLSSQPELVNAGQPGGGRPLHLAAFFRQTEAVALLLEHGANVHLYSLFEKPHVPRNTALHAALAGGGWEAASLLVEAGADVNAVDSIGLIPLHNAAFAGHVPSIELLLSRGANVNARDLKQETPLTKALQRGHAAAVECLRRNGGTE